jgi:GNAT superfamily N-acetyltransferase
MRKWINLVEGTKGYIYGDEGLNARKREADTRVFTTKDGRVIHMHNSGSEVVAAVDGEQAGYLDLRNDAPMDVNGAHKRSDADWWVNRAWVEEPFRGQGIATAMYDYAYLAGFRPLKRSHSQTEGGKAIWQKRGARSTWKLAESANSIDLKQLASKLKADGLRDVKIVGERWLVHFTGYNEEISGQGFTKGTPLTHEGWKGTWGTNHNEPGVNFACDIDDDQALEFWAWQCPSAVVFKVPSGVTCWHKDGFDQILFWGPSAMIPIIAIEMNVESTSAPEEEDWRITHVNGSPEAGEPTPFYDLLAMIRGGHLK